MAGDSRPSVLKRKQEKDSESPPLAAADVPSGKRKPTEDEIKSPTENNNAKSGTATGRFDWIIDEDDRDLLPNIAAAAAAAAAVMDIKMTVNFKPSALKKKRKDAESPLPAAADIPSERLTPTEDEIELSTENSSMISESAKGRFGWVKVDKNSVLLPYIVRVINNVHIRFVAVRAAEVLLTKYLKFLHPDLIKICTYVEAYAMTPTEAHLMNIINQKHANRAYGRAMFKADVEFVVSLDEVLEFYEFLKVCDCKIRCDAAATFDREDTVGFIRIKGSDVHLPYRTKDHHKYLPVLLFDGSTELLLDRAIKLEKWHLAYLKFCLYVMGVRESFYAGNSCLMAVTLDELKRHFPPETVFEAVRWPDEFFDTGHLINGGIASCYQSAFWIKPVNASLSAFASRVNSTIRIDSTLLQQQSLNDGSETDGGYRSPSLTVRTAPTSVTRSSTTSFGDASESVKPTGSAGQSDDDVPVPISNQWSNETADEPKSKCEIVKK